MPKIHECQRCAIAKYDENKLIDKYFCPILETFLPGYYECSPNEMITLVFARLYKLEKGVERLNRKGRSMR